MISISFTWDGSKRCGFFCVDVAVVPYDEDGSILDRHYRLVMTSHSMYNPNLKTSISKSMLCDDISPTLNTFAAFNNSFYYLFIHFMSM